MSIDPKTKKQWQETQAQYDYPVDDRGKPINPKNQNVLRVWREEGIIGFVRQKV